MLVKLKPERRRSGEDLDPRTRLRVGALAKATGKTVRALHLYEELGLLVPERSKSGYRIYAADAALRVRWISKLQEMGFSLTDIQEIAQEWGEQVSAPSAMKRVREIYRERLTETRKQMQRLRELHDELLASLDYLDTCDTCDPNRLIESCSCCDREHRQFEAPELVAGFIANAEESS
ncbi:MAG: MerR family transcriptional regulator [Myxococcota bacterium]